VKKGLFLLVVFIHAAISIMAQDVYHAKLADKPERISKNFLYLEDATGQLSVNEIMSSPDFKPTEDDVPNFNISKSTFWAKGKITVSEEASWYLTMIPSGYNRINFYQRKNRGEWKEKIIGAEISISEKDVQNNFLFFKLDIKPGDTIDVLFRLQDYLPLQFDIKIGTLESHIPPAHFFDLYYGICFGIMMMMLIYNFYLYLTQKKRIYVFYVLYVFASLVFCANMAGYSIHYPKWFFAINSFSPVLAPALFGAFGILFTLELFKGFLPPILRKITIVFIGGVSIVTILGSTSYIHFAENTLQICGLGLAFISITSGIIAIRKKHSAGLFYLIGFGAYTLSLAYLIFCAQNIFPVNEMTWRSLVTGAAVESIFLSFALGDKFKFAQQEQERAKEEALFQARENERLVREQNMVLEEKVKERTLQLEEKNKEILDSIHYARRIQNTLLAQESLLKEFIPEHFIYFKPKDIVSGDFYWATQKEDRLYIAVCDSTGHGVPGAFMSLLNISFLNEAITEKNILQPNEIFNYVRKRLIENISKDGQKDGMDGVLLCFDKKNKKITYAAANNSPLIYQDNVLEELKGDKMPVGDGHKLDSFNLYTVDENKKGLLYLFTDGYVDQFGGPDGKKYKYRRLFEKLVTITHSPLTDQRDILSSNFEEWKGNLEQIDDVCVVGIQL
jgi:two-component system, sensor histidine kinase LadS